MKHLFIVLDGAGDRNYKELKKESPLGYAKTLNLDKLASKSKLGRVNVIKKGLAPESDAAVLSLLGYDVFKEYPGRGLIESIGAGWKPEKNTIYFRANFATINNKREVTDSRAGRIEDNLAKKLVQSINKIRIKGAKFKLKHTIGHRSVLKVTSNNLSDNIICNNNFYQEIPNSKLHKALNIKLPVKLKSFKPRDKSIESKNTAILMELYTQLVHELLEEHEINKNRKKPANILLLRGPGSSIPGFKTMKEKTGLDWAGIVEMPVEEGICKLTDMKPVFVKQGINQLKNYLKKTLTALKTHDAVYVHIKGPDLPSHDGDIKEKIRVFEEIDKDFFKTLLEKINMEKTIIIVTADHSTECALKAHTSLPTPLLFYKPGNKSDNFQKFSENNCKKGSIGIINGKNIIKLFSKQEK